MDASDQLLDSQRMDDELPSSGVSFPAGETDNAVPDGSGRQAGAEVETLERSELGSRSRIGENLHRAPGDRFDHLNQLFLSLDYVSSPIGGKVLAERFDVTRLVLPGEPLELVEYPVGKACSSSATSPSRS